MEKREQQFGGRLLFSCSYHCRLQGKKRCALSAFRVVASKRYRVSIFIRDFQSGSAAVRGEKGRKQKRREQRRTRARYNAIETTQNCSGRAKRGAFCFVPKFGWRFYTAARANLVRCKLISIFFRYVSAYERLYCFVRSIESGGKAIYSYGLLLLLEHRRTLKNETSTKGDWLRPTKRGAAHL